VKIACARSASRWRKERLRQELKRKSVWDEATNCKPLIFSSAGILKIQTPMLSDLNVAGELATDPFAAKLWSYLKS
jgi:hypothetical protein